MSMWHLNGDCVVYIDFICLGFLKNPFLLVSFVLDNPSIHPKPHLMQRFCRWMKYLSWIPSIDDQALRGQGEHGQVETSSYGEVDDEKEIVEYTEEDTDEDVFEYAIHDLKVKWNVMKSVLRERYEFEHQLKLCLTNYSIYKGYKIHFRKCDTVKLVVVCPSDLEKRTFIVRVSGMSTEKSFEVKKMNDRQTCVRSFSSSSLMNPTWVDQKGINEENMDLDGMDQENIREEGMDQEGMNQEGINEDDMDVLGMNQEGIGVERHGSRGHEKEESKTENEEAFREDNKNTIKECGGCKK
ncbi:unnamed protein product [Lactuca saligna]|uniref:Uncharacterized protein n=1 Tax=Lactuca saligna TaxID=75948 RepID=A0AA35ULW3_LACSI|nr:unnamed protein product [Lactuca saligna]